MAVSTRHGSLVFPQGGPINVGVGQAVETDTALTVTHSAFLIAVGLVVETDTALAAPPAKGAVLGVPAETDMAFSVVHPVAPVNTVAPSIIGVAEVGNTVRVLVGAWQ